MRLTALPSLKLTGRLFLIMLATCLLLVVGIATVWRWSVQADFQDFVQRMGRERVTTVASELADTYASHGGWAFLFDDPRAWPRLMRSLADEAGTSPHDPLMPRLWLLDAEGQTIIAGRGQPDLHNALRRAVVVDGRTVGWVIGNPSRHLAEPPDLRFYAQQQRTMLWTAGLALLLAALAALVSARSLLRPIRELAGATHRLAAGDYHIRVTDNRRDELGALAHDFNQLAHALARNETLRRQLIADVSHELRTPLAVLRGEIEALEDGVRPLTPEALGSLAGEVALLTKLVDDLHALSLADAGALAYHRRPTDLPECLNAVAGAFADRLAGRQLHLQLQLPGHAELLADPDRLRQLFHNLFENSLRYTDPGGTLRIRCRQTPQALELDWEDSAPGVTPEQQAHLFDRFYRADSSRRRAAGGSGLGLAICREIVLAHGGDILAEPSELGGLALHLTFPLRPT
jgi:two-component system sensor histidine kinase BaeS